MDRIELCIFAKAPVHGRVKTRLARTIGDVTALAVYRTLLRHTAAIAHDWPGPVRLLLSGTWPADEPDPFVDLPATPQRGSGLGERLAAGLGPHLPAIAIGTDCPELTTAALAGLAAALDDHDVAIGPAHDGGYWALGLSHRTALRTCCDPALPWSRPELLDATRSACTRAGLSVKLGCDMQDIDDANDLARARRNGFIYDPPPAPAL
ncbi:MAG: TIGR04282 family arsenosugar biosynthesis glycosyltransferase [Planctomycetota bacterium]